MEVQSGKQNRPGSFSPAPTRAKKQIDPELILAFKEMAGQVTTEDVMEAALEKGCHYATVQRYLRGEVKKEKFGIELLDLLRNKVSARKTARIEIPS